MKKVTAFIILIVSSFLAWNFFGIMLIISIASIFFILENKSKKWYYNFLEIFFIAIMCNLSSTFWLINSNFLEGITAIIANSFLMFIPLFLISLSSSKWKLCCYIVFWLCFEILHSNWDLSWTWLTYGNSMGNMHYLIQWYSFFWVFSGSIWLITLGYFLYKTIHSKKNIITFLVILLIPIFFSLTIYLKNTDYKGVIKIATYINKEKDKTNFQKAKKIYFEIQDKKETDYTLICPEVFFEKTNILNLKQNNEGLFLKKIIP